MPETSPPIKLKLTGILLGRLGALAYQIGKLKILDLRDRAKQRLGPHFDIRAFHDEILGGGSLPLDMLEARVENWNGSQLPNGATR